MSIPSPRCLLATLLASAAVLVAAAPAGAVEVGTVPDITWGTSRATIDRTVGMLQDAGVQWVRASVPWNAIEPDRPGAYNQSYLSDIDYAIAKARAAGIDVIVPVQDGVPYWASADPAKYTDASGTRHWVKAYRPRDYADYARFFAFVADRYKGLGVHAYEVWNEPNLARFWPSGPDAGQFTQMLQAAYPAIKAADPSSTVILGGLSGNDRTYLASVYAHGARGSFDAVGVHPYAYGDPTKCWTDSTGHNAKDAFCGLDEMRKVMAANGDGDKPMWITEMGWSTCNNAASACYGSGVTEAQQADYFTKAFNLLDAKYPQIPVAVVYNFRNNAWQNDDPNDWEAQTGLVTTQFAPKPAYYAVAAYAKAHPRASGAGAQTGTSTSPATTPTPTPTPAPTPAPTPTPAPKKKKGKTATSAAHASTAGLQRVLKVRVGAAGRARMAVTGRVRPAHRGWVRLRFERWDGAGHDWKRTAVRHARVHGSGRFDLRTHRASASGRWRVRARFMVRHGVAGSRAVRRSFDIAG